MVPIRLSKGRGRTARTAALAAALTLAACGREAAQQQEDEAGAGLTEDARAAELVRAQYTAPDVEAAAAWVWASPDSVRYVLIGAQSAVQGMVQARAELWMAGASEAALFGRSEVLPSAAEIGAYAFQDLSGDGVPDLLGYVSDSSGVSYPVFFPGSRPGMTEEIALAAPGWRFSTDEVNEPRAYGIGGMTCALQLWAEEPAPDGAPEGWRWLALQHDGSLSAPVATAPTCGEMLPAGVQPAPGQP